MNTDSATMLDERAALELVHRLLGGDFRAARIDRLTGGVSALVYRVAADGLTVVIKQSRPVLDVPGYWASDPARSAFEGRALRLMGQLTPGRVPELLAADDDVHVLIMEAAPQDWVPLKPQLMAGRNPKGTSRLIGECLAHLHIATLDSPDAADGFSRQKDLEDLRIRPYFEVTAKERPEFAALMREAAGLLRQTGRCLVHGDATPKNVLSPEGGGDAWLLDPEVAHFGQPEFDIALWSAHMILKMSRIQSAVAATEALTEFADAYASLASDLVDDHALRILAEAVVRARLHGLSRVDYLNDLDLIRLEGLLQVLRDTREPVIVLLASAGELAP